MLIAYLYGQRITTTPNRFCGKCGAKAEEPSDAFCREWGAAYWSRASKILAGSETTEKANSLVTTEGEPKNFEGYINRGNAYFNLKQYERAIEDYTEAIHLKPEYALAYYSRGVSYSYLGQYQRATGLRRGHPP